MDENTTNNEITFDKLVGEENITIENIKDADKAEGIIVFKNTKAGDNDPVMTQLLFKKIDDNEKNSDDYRTLLDQPKIDLNKTNAKEVVANAIVSKINGEDDKIPKKDNVPIIGGRRRRKQVKSMKKVPSKRGGTKKYRRRNSIRMKKP